MWNLRWQVAGYVSERPGARNDELERRFVAGSDIGSANLRRHCLDTTWQSQLNELGVLTLFQAIGLYEGWVAGFEIGNKTQRERLMFPSQSWTGKKEGGPDFLASLSPSDGLTRAYSLPLSESSRCLPARLDDLLVTFRSFKEVRNSCAHGGRLASDLAVSTTAEAKDCSAGFGLRDLPLRLADVRLNEPIEFGLLEAKAACALLLKLVTTLDHGFACTDDAERIFAAEWKTKIGTQMLSANAQKREARLSLLSKRAGFPVPDDATGVYDVLRQRYLVI